MCINDTSTATSIVKIILNIKNVWEGQNLGVTTPLVARGLKLTCLRCIMIDFPVKRFVQDFSILFRRAIDDSIIIMCKSMSKVCSLQKK
jgi:hypothetical protein